MSAPNPQYDAILGLLNDQNGAYELRDCELSPETQYFVGDKQVVCLGVYHELGVAVFGEWQGSADEKPKVALEKMQDCTTSVLIRSATQEESKIYGGSKVVVYLRVAGVESSKFKIHHYTAKITFQLPHSGFYNPVV